MPYALFSNDAKLSKAYPDRGRCLEDRPEERPRGRCRLREDNAAPRPVLDHDYEIRPCQLEPHEDPARNKAEAEREAQTELQLAS